MTALNTDSDWCLLTLDAYNDCEGGVSVEVDHVNVGGGSSVADGLHAGGRREPPVLLRIASEKDSWLGSSLDPAAVPALGDATWRSSTSSLSSIRLP
jgi:hypothetical protein